VPESEDERRLDMEGLLPEAMLAGESKAVDSLRVEVRVLEYCTASEARLAI